MNTEDEQIARESLLTHPLPAVMLEMLDLLVRKYPTVSILQGCGLHDDGNRLEANLTYIVFVPIPAENMCLIQEFHNFVVFDEARTAGV